MRTAPSPEELLSPFFQPFYCLFLADSSLQQGLPALPKEMVYLFIRIAVIAQPFIIQMPYPTISPQICSVQFFRADIARSSSPA